MTQPSVFITELDGALGVLPPSSGRLFALVGPSDSGPVDMPATFARTKDVISNFVGGPLVEAAAHYIERYGRPVVLVRTTASAVGSYEAIVEDVTGTSVPTVDATTHPNDDYEAYIAFVAGGTIGTPGITYQWSLDGGRTLSPVTALGTANTITIPGSGGIKIDFAVGTIIAGDSLSVVANAPKWSDVDLESALDALRATSIAWELAHIVGPIDADSFDVIDLAFSGMASVGKEHAWIGNTRIPDADETEAEYLTALSTEFAAKATVLGMLCAGAEKLTSSVSGRKYRRPVAYSQAALEASVSEEVDTADVNLGGHKGVSIRDVNGNPDEHDESANPGLDDARFCVLRTWDGIQGVHTNRPRIFSSEGSDFQLMPHRRVMNLARAALRVYFVRRLNKPVLVSSSTGFILEGEALEIEAGANAILRSALRAKPKASATTFTLSRTDNLLSTKTLTGQARIVPLAYPEYIELDIGFLNPALQVQAV